MTWVKRIILTLVVLFALFYLITQPVGAAEAVRTVFAAVAKAFHAIVVFFTSLAR
jgi:hypothetical protein